MSMSCYVLLNKKLVFFFSFKSGNTSLAYWIYNYLKSRSDFVVGNKDIPVYLNNPNMHISAGMGWSLIKNNNFKGVVLSRDPYARIVSAFVNKFIVDGDRWIKSYDNLEHFSKVFLGDSCKSGVSFMEFLNSIYNYSVSGQEINRHFAPQVSDKLLDKNFFTYQVRLESVDNDLRKMCESEGLVWRPFPRLRTTKINLRLFDGDASKISCFDLANKELLPKKKNLLTADAISLINKIYEKDFSVFGYDKL